MKLKNLSLTLLALFSSSLAQAAIFDAADILPQNSGAVGAFGEILLSDPTSEGLEARGRYGLSDDWNVGLHLGTGSKNKKFRFGAEAVYNILPDWEGQVGFSVLGTTTYIRRGDAGALQLRVAPLVHKRLESWSGNPATVYASLPFYVEGKSGTYHTATQLVLGSTFDLADSNRFYLVGEAGIRLSKAESYVLFGAGLRLGDLRFEKRERGGKRDGNAPRTNDDEYRDADFQ